MYRQANIPLMRLPRWRRMGIWLAFVAIAMQMLVMAAHRPASAAALPDIAAALCITSGEPPAQAHPDSDGDDAAVKHVRLCPFCQALHAGAPLPQSTASVDAPLIPAGGPPDIAAPVAPPRLAFSDLNPRGPPSSV